MGFNFWVTATNWSSLAWAAPEATTSLARDVVASGKALAKMHQFVAKTKELLPS